MSPAMLPYRAVFPLARTAALSLLAACLFAVLGLAGYWLRGPVEIQDKHVDGELLQGLVLLSQAWQAAGAPKPAAATACLEPTAELAGELADIQRLAGNSQPITPALDCSQLHAVDKAARWLLRQETGRLRAILRSPAPQLADWIAQRDPFRLPGCLLMRSAAAPSIPGYCADKPGWRGAELADLPPGADALWVSLAHYRQVRSPTPNRYEHRADGLVTPLAQGRHQWLTLNPAAQHQAQLTAACYTGDSAACAQCPWCNTSAAVDMFEGARARMAGILLVDARDGAILAAASAHSPCYAAQHRGQALPAGCPNLPSPPAARAWRLNNHALEQAAMPASLVKIPLAAGLIEAGIPADSRAAMVNDWLVRSDTEAFLDTALCKDQRFLAVCAKQRVAAIQRMAGALGWNRGCGGGAGCGRRDLLSAGQAPDLSYPVMAGRLLIGGDNIPAPIARLRLNNGAMIECYRHGHKERWRGCRGADFVDLLAELYGQGNAVATPVGVADSLLQLAAAAAGNSIAPVAHLLQPQHEGGTRSPVVAGPAPAMRAETARLILEAMAQTHLRGTAHAACVQAAQTGGVLACQASDNAPLRLAGKTGTPLFPADTSTLEQWREQCARELAKPQLGPNARDKHRQALARCGLAPYKWYAALLGSGDAWHTALVVLAERNWNQRTGMVDSVEDHGPNVAAELGLALANALSSPADTLWRAPGITEGAIHAQPSRSTGGPSAQRSHDHGAEAAASGFHPGAGAFGLPLPPGEGWGEGEIKKAAAFSRRLGKEPKAVPGGFLGKAGVRVFNSHGPLPPPTRSRKP